MTKRLSFLVAVLAWGCVFTPRPMIPFTEDAGAFTGAFGDGGRTGGADAPGVPFADAGASMAADAAAADVPAGSTDSECHPAGDAGDAGFVDQHGSPCDPTASVDGGARDASCDGGDASTDAPTADRPDGGAACDAPVGAVQVQR